MTVHQHPSPPLHLLIEPSLTNMFAQHYVINTLFFSNDSYIGHLFQSLYIATHDNNVDT